MLFRVVIQSLLNSINERREILYFCLSTFCKHNNSNLKRSSILRNIANMPLAKDVLDQQVDDLRDRMQLLQQDRRANVDMLEANKFTNSEEIRSLRDENKELRLKLTQLQKRLSSERGEQHELVTFKREALHLRTDYDSMKVISNKRQQEMNKLIDEAKICELEAKPSIQGNGPLVRKIRVLENK